MAPAPLTPTPWPLPQDRGYVERQGRALRATTLGRLLSAFLTHYFARYMDYGFTSGLEEQLDEVAGETGGGDGWGHHIYNKINELWRQGIDHQVAQQRLLSLDY